jgi:hypothetical protein
VSGCHTLLHMKVPKVRRGVNQSTMDSELSMYQVVSDVSQLRSGYPHCYVAMWRSGEQWHLLCAFKHPHAGQCGRLAPDLRIA